MSDEIRVNRPGVAQQPQVAATPVMEEPKASKMPWIILAVVVVVLLVLGFLFRDKLFGKSKVSETPAPSATKLSGYQAVFLTNGQVYFGKISSQSENELVVKDIYYLQVVQPPLQGQATDPNAAPAEQQPQISLVKLGSELHGPADEMHIYKNQVLFYEDLTESGKVAQAIKEYKANPAQQPVPAK